MKPRKPLKPKSGHTYKKMQQNAKIRLQIDDERARHRAALDRLALRRTRLLQRPDDPERAIDLQIVAHDFNEEVRRHHVKVLALRGRIVR